MNKPNQQPSPAETGKTMESIVALCRRRGFVFQSSEIYGGINGFWDYGPLGVELKRNLKEAWWKDMVRCSPDGPDGQPIAMVGQDSTIIMNPKVWEASGHVGGFNDPMVDCRECKGRFRADHVWEAGWFEPSVFGEVKGERDKHNQDVQRELDQATTLEQREQIKSQFRPLGDAIDAKLIPKFQKSIVASNHEEAIEQALSVLTKKERKFVDGLSGPTVHPHSLMPRYWHPAHCPSCQMDKSLTEPRQFNLMFKTHCGAMESEDSLAYLRPETAQGIFANFRNIVDTSRVKVPFGIAQIGKAFRNEVTPRNFTFRSREFEQMEIEFFIHPDTANEWYAYWRDSRYAWWQSIGLAGENLILREHDRDELAHYAKEGAGTSDIEYRFPFTAPGFGELEGVAHRTDFDLRQHAEHSGLGDKLKYFDQEKNERYFPHVIEPSAGADRGTLALLCEAYTPDPDRPSKVFMKFHPRMAPIKAAVFPLVNKDGMPEMAQKLHLQLRSDYAVQFDVKQSIGKRYARMDEAGTPYCFTIDGQSLEDQTVTVRHRDSLDQHRLPLDGVRAFLAEHIG